MIFDIKLSDALRSSVAATLIIVAQVAWAANPLGTNLGALNYYSTNFPFLNIVKQCGSNSPTVGWFTGNGGTDTGEQLKLNLDSDGYPLAIPQSGLTSNSVSCRVFNTGFALAPGQSAYYPSGSYTVQFSGAGTVTISGDASATISASGGTFTVLNPTSFGLFIGITASIPGNHLHNLSVVQTSLLSSYNAGAIFHPKFLATVANYQSFRFMDWKNTNNQTSVLNLGGNINAGSIALTLENAWNRPSGNYTVYFQTGSDSAPQSESRSATFTAGATTVTWSGGLANNYSYAAVDVSYPWANRALPSNAVYTLQDGVPLEVLIALCNTVGASCYVNLPLTASDSYIQNWGSLVINGTGAQSGYSALNSGLTFYAELSNEVWNSLFTQYGVAGTLGYQMWPTQGGSPDQYAYNRNWYGMRVAQMANDLKTQLGNAFSQCVPVLGSQAASTYPATQALLAPYWTTGTGPPSSYPIKAVAIAPYWGGNPSSTDATTMTAVATPLDDFFATLTSQTGTISNGNHTYSSVPAGGWLGQAEGWISAYATMMSSYPTMRLIAYEGGQNFYATSSGTASAWPALVTKAERDMRMGTGYTTYLNFWKNTAGSKSANMNHLYNDIGEITTYGAWGALETVMQTISPLTSAPAKFQSIQNYIGTINVPMQPTNLVVH